VSRKPRARVLLCPPGSDLSSRQVPSQNLLTYIWISFWGACRFSNGQSVCAHLVVGAVDFEKAALEELKGVAAEICLPSRVLKIFESASDFDGSGAGQEELSIEKALKATGEKIAALLSLVEPGVVL
jgi:hypothetical protein